MIDAVPDMGGKDIKMNILSPSLLAANFSKLEEELRDITDGGAKYLHLDVMDGSFVPSISFGMPVIKSLRNTTELCFDVHLMIENPERYIEEFADCGADIITIHAEATHHLNRVLMQIKECGRKAGVALNPATPLSALEYVLEYADMVLLMSVNPGFGGQQYIANSTKKIKELRKLMEDRGISIDIEVDGGIKLSNVREVLGAGANVIVAGSAVFNDKTLENTREFLNVLTSQGD